MSAVYSSIKTLHYRDRLDAMAEGRPSAPIHVRIKPTNRCNHNCWYCAYRTDAVSLGEDMDEADIIPQAKMAEIVEDIIAMGIKAVTFSGGGEPLLYPSLPETIKVLGAAGVRLATLTNGVNLKGRVADALAAHATWVRVSIDAWDSDSYVRSRSAKPGDFDKVIENMRAFKQRAPNCELGVSYIIDEANHVHIFDMVRLFKSIGVNHVKLAGVVTSNDPGHHNAYHARFADETNRQLVKAAELADERFQVLNHVHRMAESFEKPYHTCRFNYFLTVIGADCTVYTCQDKAYTQGGILGSIRERRFREFWFSEDNRKALAAINPSRHCQHHCVAHGKNLALEEYFSLDPSHTAFV